MKPKLVSITLGTKSPSIYKNIDRDNIQKIEGGILFKNKNSQITWVGNYAIKAMPKEKKDGRTVTQVSPGKTNE